MHARAPTLPMILSALALALGACSSTSEVRDAGEPDAGAADGATDAAPAIDAAGDASPLDAADADAGIEDAAAEDAHAPDAHAADLGPRYDAGSSCPLPSGDGEPFRLRAMAANLTSGNGQSYDPGDGQRIMQGLTPDVVLIQEFNFGDDTPEALAQFVRDTFSEEYQYARGLGGQIPNGVVSRWPILESGDWEDPEVGNRAFTWAHIDLPGPRDLWAVSLHLLTSSTGDRNAEGRALIAALEAHVPAGDFILIGGDFNTDSRSEGVFDILGARVDTEAPHPVDNEGNPGTNKHRSKPYDSVFASPCLRADQVPVEIGSQIFPDGLVFDSRVYQPLEDVDPVLESDSAAPNMQHMAVVKDFLISP